MKAQFMLISAVIAALIMMTAGAVISDIESQSFESEDLQHQLMHLENQASEADLAEDRDRHSFEETVETLDYDTEVEYWNHQGEWCANVTLERPGEQHRLECLG